VPTRGWPQFSSRGGPILGSGSAGLRGALCLAPFEKMPRFTQIRSGTSPQVTWRSRSAACQGYAPPTRCHPTIRLGALWGNGSYVQFLPAPPQAATSSVAICLANSGWPLTESAWSIRRVAPIWFGIMPTWESPQLSSGGGTILESGSARLSGALCLAPFEKMPRHTQIRSGTSSQVTWRSWSTACPRYAPPTWCHPTIQLGRPW
jgi:hypothetical protein